MSYTQALGRYEQALGAELTDEQKAAIAAAAGGLQSAATPIDSSPCVNGFRFTPDGGAVKCGPTDAAAPMQTPEQAQAESVGIVKSFENLWNSIWGGTPPAASAGAKATGAAAASSGGGFVSPPQTTGSPIPKAPPATPGMLDSLLGPMSDNEKLLLGGAAIGIAYLLYKRSQKKGRRK